MKLVSFGALSMLLTLSKNYFRSDPTAKLVKKLSKKNGTSAILRVSIENLTKDHDGC